MGAQSMTTERPVYWPSIGLTNFTDRPLALLTEAGELGNAEIRERMQLKDRTHVREHYIDPALTQGLIEMTIPYKPRSRLQKYRLTAQGRTVQDAARKND